MDQNFSVRFDGADDRTETPDSDDLDLTDTWTIEGWLKPDDITGADFQAIIEKWGLPASGQSGGVHPSTGVRIAGRGALAWHRAPRHQALEHLPYAAGQPLFASANPVEWIIDHVKTVPRPPRETVTAG